MYIDWIPHMQPRLSETAPESRQADFMGALLAGALDEAQLAAQAAVQAQLAAQEGAKRATVAAGAAAAVGAERNWLHLGYFNNILSKFIILQFACV